MGSGLMGKRKEKISSNIAWSTPDKICVRGLDLPNEILGHMNLGDLAFLQLTGRKLNQTGFTGEVGVGHSAAILAVRSAL
jgi:hypothetical protein